MNKKKMMSFIFLLCYTLLHVISIWFFMETDKYFSQNELKKYLSQSSQKEFEDALVNFSLPEIIDSLLVLQPQPSLDAKQKLLSLFRHVATDTNLEALGKKFTPSTFVCYLEFLESHPTLRNRLFYILIGLQSSIFSASLLLLENRHLTVLKTEAFIEPLQYHLMQFAHEGESLKLSMHIKAQEFSKNLFSLQQHDLTDESLKIIFNKIEEDKNSLMQYLEKARYALIIVWHTDRIDLIETLSSIHESIQHQISFLIGHPTFNETRSTGLYRALEEHFSSIFDGLKDQDAAIEGMTRLSIWHPNDYIAIGLLPAQFEQERINVSEDKKDIDKERVEKHEKFISIVQKRLEELGITNVEALKKHHLFSQSILKNYIERVSTQS